MIKVTESDLSNYMKLSKSGNKGWYSTDCPYCEKQNHLGITFDSFGSFNCFKCGEKGSLYKLLKFIGILNKFKDNKVIEIDAYIDCNIFQKKESSQANLEFHEIKKPIGYKQIFELDYITNRGISEDIFYAHDVGITKIEKKLLNRVIFLFEYKNKNIGYIARSILSNDEIKKIENNTDRRYLRYINSANSDFSKYLYGLSEISENTHTIILVEGIFDKLKTDTELDLIYQDEVKCCCCFGKKISDFQILLLQQLNIQNIILLFDNDAIKESKEYGAYLSNFFNTSIGLCNKKDPGDMNAQDFIKVFSDLKSPNIFNNSTISIKL